MMMGNTAISRNYTETFSSSLTENISNTLISISKTNSNVISGSQTINITNLRCRAGINISGLTQKAVYTINTQVLSNVVNKDNLSKMLTTATKQAADTAQKTTSGGLFSGNSISDNTTKIINNNIQSIVNSYSYNDFQSDLSQIQASQIININSLVSNEVCNISDLSQHAVLESLAKNISKRLISKTADIVNKASTTQSTKTSQDSETKGLFDFSFLMPVMVIIALLFIMFVIIIAWRMMRPSDPVK